MKYCIGWIKIKYSILKPIYQRILPFDHSCNYHLHIFYNKMWMRKYQWAYTTAVYGKTLFQSELVSISRLPLPQVCVRHTGPVHIPLVSVVLGLFNAYYIAAKVVKNQITTDQYCVSIFSDCNIVLIVVPPKHLYIVK